jgi:hypothetical protein
VEEVEPDSPVSPDEREATHRALYAQKLRLLSVDEREQLASTADEPTLSALCFDPIPGVIRKVFENTRAGLAHARLVALHHPASSGLEFVVSRPAFLHDTQVQNALLRNPQLTEAQLRRVTTSRSLSQLYKVTQSRELPEQTRRAVRALFRSRFTQATADERVEVIFQTEGRVLATLVGVALDSKTTSLLCGRPYNSVFLIQSFARWAATPPMLLAHLLKEPVVQRQQALRRLLSQHSNAPKGAH